ncbi:MAG: FecR domain-containing protein [Planctomycetota bacterium]|nr:FecR domain-containing protein [Planctomycetota bacterium]
MKCGDVIRNLPRLFLKELSAQESSRLAEHVENCPSCAREHEAVKRAMAMIRDDEGAAPNGVRRERVLAAVRAEVDRHAAAAASGAGVLARLRSFFWRRFSTEARSMGWPSWRVPAFAAAFGLVMLGVLAFSLSAGGRFRAKDEDPVATVSIAEGHVEVQKNATTAWVPVRSGQQLNPGDRVSTREGSYAMVRLGDGLVVEMNSATRIQIGPRSGAGQPAVLNFYRGNAWFEVRPGEDREGLLIYAPGGVVKAANARFELSY